MKNSPTPKASFLNLSAGGSSGSEARLPPVSTMRESGQTSRPLPNAAPVPPPSLFPDAAARDGLSASHAAGEWRGGATRLTIRLGLVAVLFLVTFVSVVAYQSTVRLLQVQSGGARYSVRAQSDQAGRAAEAARLGEQRSSSRRQAGRSPYACCLPRLWSPSVI